MVATSPLSSSQFASLNQSRTRMTDQEAAEKLNSQIDDELKVRKSFFTIPRSSSNPKLLERIRETESSSEAGGQR